MAGEIQERVQAWQKVMEFDRKLLAKKAGAFLLFSIFRTRKIASQPHLSNERPGTNTILPRGIGSVPSSSSP
jgi:hypothetical protein